MAKHQRGSSGHPERPSKPSKARQARVNLSPYLELPLASLDDSAFKTLCDEIRTALAPRDSFEDQLARWILLTYRQVRLATLAVQLKRTGAARALKEEKSFFRFQVKSYFNLRELFGDEPKPTILTPPPEEPEPTRPTVEKPAPIEPETPPLVPEPDQIEADARNWRQRIAMVPEIDPRWPVIDRLGFLVDEVLSDRDRGVSDEELLDQFPGLTYSDLTACYACELEGRRGPLEPPYPNDLAVLDLEPGDE